MPAMLMPTVNSYFAIYTLEGAGAMMRRGLNWDLHATATDRGLAISHARMLALQPGVSEVQVKEIKEDLTSGMVRVRSVKRCKRGQTAQRLIFGGIALASAAAMIALKLLF
jgi:hypothetical protein